MPRKDKRGPAQPVEFNLWLWTHPPVTAGVLVAGMAVLISLVKYSLISVVANISLAVLMAGVACKVYVHLMGFLKKPCTDPLDSVKDIDVTLPGDKVEAFVTSAAETINCVSSSLRSLILVENYVESIKFGVLMYLLTFIGAIFNTLTLLILGWICAFIFPTIYDQNQAQLDDLFAQIVEKYNGINDKLSAMLPAAGAKKVVVNGSTDAAQKEE